MTEEPGGPRHRWAPDGEPDPAVPATEGAAAPGGRHAEDSTEPPTGVIPTIPEPPGEVSPSSPADPAPEPVAAVVEPVAEAAPAAAPAPVARGGGRDVVRTVARGLGQTLITAGVVVLLFVVYEVYITDIFSAHKQEQATAALEQKWADPTATTTTAVQSTSQGSTDVVQVPGSVTGVAQSGTRKQSIPTTLGEGFARIYIPAFGSDYSYTIIEGTNPDDLDAGPGHYQDTQLPGDPGNFSIAGHRVSKGSPFNELGLLNSCDALVIETQNNWYVYRVLPMDNEIQGWNAAQHAHCDGVKPLTGQYSQTVGRTITSPSDYAQVLPVPEVDSNQVPANAQKLITLTTCHPQFSDAQRMIIHGVLVKSYPKKAGFTPTELQES